MSQAHRLPKLLKMLRHYDDPISGADLAEALGIPLSVLYKDIAVLRAVGVEIVSEPGQGYVLPPSAQLPPQRLASQPPNGLTNWFSTRIPFRGEALCTGCLKSLVCLIA